MPRTRCLRLVAASSALALGLMFCASASAAPYVSCPGGYIARSLKDCPPWPPIGGIPHPPTSGGGGGGNSVLGELLDGLGLGGLL